MRATTAGIGRDRTWWWWLGAALVASGCGGPPITPSDAGSDASVDAPMLDGGPTSGAWVRFVLPATGLPRPLDVPWPTDLYRSDVDGTISDELTDWSLLGAGRGANAFDVVGALDGFGLQGGALFHVDGEALDAGSLPDEAACATTSTIGLVDVDAASASAGMRVACATAFSARTHSIAIWPAAPLEPGHAYAAFVTDSVRTASGLALMPTDAFAAIRDSAPGARDGAAGQLYGDAIDRVLTLTGLDRAHLVGLAPFTTQTLPARPSAMRTVALASTPEPTLITDSTTYPMRRFGTTSHPGWTATLDEWMGTAPLLPDGTELAGTWGDAMPAGVGNDAIGAVLEAAFTAPRFTRPFTRSGGQDDGTIALDASGTPIIDDPSVQIPVLIALPRTAPPTSGWPVVIFQHGNTQHRVWALVIANELARAGIATVAIDAPFNGMRGAGATDVTSAFRATGATYDGPDGAPDSTTLDGTIAMLGDFVHLLTARDNFWQAALDLVAVRRLVGNAALDLSPVDGEWAGATPHLDPTRVGYVGMSLGAFVGTLFAAIEPSTSVNPFVLSAHGAHVVRSLPDAPDFVSQWPTLAALRMLDPHAISDAASPYAHVAQAIFDPADPGLMAALAAQGPDGAGHDLWHLGGMLDESVPRASSDDFVRLAQLVYVTPSLRPITGTTSAASPLGPDVTSGRTRAYFEVAPGGHGHIELRAEVLRTAWPWPQATDPRFVTLPTPPIVRQPIVALQRAIAQFVLSTWAGAATIDVSAPELAPVADADDDGYCDDDETSAGTDAFDPTSTPASGPALCVRDLGY